MGKPVVRQYEADLPRAIKALTACIARLGYTVKSVDKENGLVTFETGTSLLSWNGQSLSAHVLEVENAVQITIGGTRKAHGAQIQVYDWGEAERIAGTVFRELKAILGPGERLSGPSSRRQVSGVAYGILAFVALVVVVITVFVSSL
jgi:hypothetical protein